MAVRDLPSATRDYERLLGRPLSWQGAHPRLGVPGVRFSLANAAITLVAPVEQNDPVGSWLARHEPGLFALVFATDDATACAAALDASPPTEGSRVIALPAGRTRGLPLLVVERAGGDHGAETPVPDDRGAAVSGLDHVVVGTQAPDAAREVWAALGLRLALDRTFDAWGMRLLFFRLGGVTVEVAAALGAATDPPAPDHLWGISYRVPDVGAARDRLATSGVDVSEVRTGRRPGTRVCTVRSHTHGVATLLLGRDAT